MINYTSPQTELVELSTDKQIMLVLSKFDSKHNTEPLEWDDSVNL